MLRAIRPQRLALWVTVAVLVAAVTGAWALERFLGRAAQNTYAISVEAGDEVLATFGLEDLRALPARRVEMQGQVEEGPALLDVLADAGVTEFQSVTVLGQGARDSGSIELGASEIDEDVLLDFAEQRGTVKVCGPGIAREDRVRDVERILVR